MIEILVVVGILGILSAVIIPNIMGLMKEGEEEAKGIEHHNIQREVVPGVLLHYVHIIVR